MLKYVAVLEVYYPKQAINWHFGVIHQRYKSPIETDKTQVERWIKEKIANYPNAIINQGIKYTETVINYCIIPFDEAEAVNIEYMLERLLL